MVEGSGQASILPSHSGSVTPKYKFPLGSQPCGLVRVEKSIVVGSMDNTLTSFNSRVRTCHQTR